MKNDLLSAVAKLTLEDIHTELSLIKRDLNWLEEDISLTNKQRTIYNDIKRRVKKLLGER